ncbi:MAG: NADH-quinone oxidoreductase subunit NuoN [Phycisphaera sp.]|nr:NADH-quinone oxidoreductase subunit NuoN [Phycisphaera sp.]
MAEKIQHLTPELLLVVAAFVVMLLGLAREASLRRATFWISLLALIGAAVLSWGQAGVIDPMAHFMKMSIAAIGAILLMVVAEVPDEVGLEPGDDEKSFDPANTSRGEFYGFFLLSLVGAMLCAGADDLIWLFLALELTSLPTYIMVATSRQDIRASEAAVKYFFLGAFAAAVFLYGFALIYGATGTTMLPEIAKVFASGPLNNLAVAGVLITVVGICFKIAAVPMHFYAADVYQGAASPVTAFLAFVPKAAGMMALILVLGAVGWPLVNQSQALVALLCVIAVATMFVGNLLALVQNNIKRLLAYSSVAHSGYMLVGLIAGPGDASRSSWLTNGVAAVLFYVVAYGIMNVAAFAVVGLMKRGGEEVESIDDIRGLAYRRPGLAAVLAIAMLSLAGIPPLVGFWGKVYLFGSAISAGYILLAVLAVLNSAIGAYYYLRVVALSFLYEPVDAADQAEISRRPARTRGGLIAAVWVVLISVVAGPLVDSAKRAAGQFVDKPETPAAAVKPAETTPTTPPASLEADAPVTLDHRESVTEPHTPRS